MAEETTVTTGAENTNAENVSTGTETTEEKGTQAMSSEAIDKLVQSRVDKAMADARKEAAALKKENDKLKREKLTEDEVKKLELADRDKELEKREKTIAEKENRYFAINAIKEAGLDNGGKTALDLVDLVVTGTGDTEETITAKVKTVKELVDKLVADEVEKTFKKNGRIPNGANVSSDTKETNNIAEKLGKERAEQNKKANEVVNYYIGGKK